VTVDALLVTSVLAATAVVRLDALRVMPFRCPRRWDYTCACRSRVVDRDGAIRD